MLKAEKGFVFPAALMLVSVSISILLMAVQLYSAEIHYSHETMEYYHKNSMIYLTLKKVMKEIKENHYAPSGTADYKEGNVRYTIQAESGDILKIQLSASLYHESEIKTEVLYNSKENRLYNWQVK